MIMPLYSVLAIGGGGGGGVNLGLAEEKVRNVQSCMCHRVSHEDHGKGVAVGCSSPNEFIFQTLTMWGTGEGLLPKLKYQH